MKRTGVFILVFYCVCLIIEKPILFPDKVSYLKSPNFDSRFFKLQEASSGWEPLGLVAGGGDISGLAFNPQNKSELYALTRANPSQIYKSTNSGRTWERIAIIFYDWCRDLGVDPSNPNIIYVLGYDNIYKSKDGGSNWNKYEYGDYFHCEGQIYIHPKDSNIIYASGTCVYNTNLWKECMGVCKSTDGGENWEVKEINPISSWGSARCMAIDPLDPDVIYAGGEYRDENHTFYKKCYKSSDGGESWKDITGSIEGWLRSIVIDPSNSSKVYVGCDDGIYRSSNGGKSWEKNNDYASANALVIDPLDSNILYAGRWQECLKSVDGGVNWTRYEDGIYGSCNRLLVFSASSTQIFFGSSVGIYKSGDGGLSWRESHSGIRAHRIEALAVVPSSPNIIYAGASGGGLFRSNDIGNSWERVDERGWWRSIVVNPDDANELLGIEGGRFFRSSDGGNSWTEVYRANDFRDLATNRNNINRIFIAGSSESGSTHQMALFKSTDGGTNWTIYNVTSTYGRANAVALDPSSDYIIYVGGWYYDNQGWRAGLFKSINGGEDWSNIGGEIERETYDITIDPISPNKIYIGTWGGIYKSEDYASTWIQPTSRFHAECIRINPDFPNDIFAAGHEGIYFSNDGGKTWWEFNEGLEIQSTNCLDIDEQNKILYAGTNGGNIYKYSLLDFYTLKISTGTGGTTDPAPGSYHYPPGTNATITAIPESGYGFTGWSGDVHNTNNPITLTMDSDKSIEASFLSYTLTISASTGGTTDPAPGSYHYPPGTNVTVTAIPESGYGFTGWGGDASGISNQITITMDSDKSIEANFLSYKLTISSGTGGTTDPVPGSYNYPPGTEVTITAKPDNLYGFRSWSGDVTGMDNPITLVMDSDKSIAANFIRIHPPLNFTGEKILNRSLLGIEYINVLSWQANPNNEGIAKYRIFQVEGNSLSLLEELDADKFEYWHRKVEKDKKYIYAIVSVYSDGSEGEPAYVTVN